MKDPNVLKTFQAMIGGMVAPLTIMSNDDTDIDSMITTFNTAVTETVSEIFGKHCKKKKTLGHCRNSWSVRPKKGTEKKRVEPEGSEKYKKVNKNIKRYMKKAKENWIGNSVVRLKKIEEKQQ